MDRAGRERPFALAQETLAKLSDSDGQLCKEMARFRELWALWGNEGWELLFSRGGSGGVSKRCTLQQGYRPVFAGGFSLSETIAEPLQALQKRYIATVRGT